MLPVIFHITTGPEAAAARGAGEYRTGSLDTEGFIHCSAAAQVGGVAEYAYADVPDLVLLCIDAEELRVPLRWESSATDGPEYPHVYGPIGMDAVVDVVPFGRDDHGRFDLPWRAAEIARRPPRTVDELRARLTDALAPYTGRWWVAGGWALDVFLGGAGRPHEDLDVTIPRPDVPRFVREMAGWQFRIPTPAALIEWLPRDYPPDQHQIWARPDDAVVPTAVVAFSAHPSAIDVLVEPIDGDEWWFRRVPTVTAPVSRYGRVDRSGLPYVAPEVQLLYKAKPHPTGMERNDDDFARVRPHLDPDARRWLRGALERAHPGHHWLARL